MDKDVFINEIMKLRLEARDRGESYLEISAGKIHRNVGGYPGKNQKIIECCEAMYALKAERDEVIQRPLKGTGATLKIRYYL